MKALRWKRGLPTKPGWYWLRSAGETEEIVRIREYGGKLALGNSSLNGWSRMEASEWAGPITKPT